MAQGLSSLLGGLAQGFTDLGKSTLDVLGGGTTNNVITAGLDALINKKSYGQAVKDANQRQKDFRKWLYETDSDKDAAAKGLGTALNGAQTAIDLIPGLGQSAPVNAIQGAIGGLADEFKFNGENYDWGKGAQRAAVGAGAGLAAGGLGKALANSGSKVLSNGVLKGAATGSLGGALSQAGGTAIEGGNADQILQSAAQGAQFGALLGAGTGGVQSLAGALKKTRAKNGAPVLDDQVEIMAELAPEQNAVTDAMLSPEQKEFFKDSVIREPGGSLKTVYHGTDADFNTFGEIKTEPGYWFTEDKDYAASHGKNLKSVNLNMKNPLDLNTTEGDNKLVEYLRECFGENASESDIYTKKFRNFLKNKGYDGMIWEHSGKNTYIAFEPNQIKDVNNLTPTNNVDIMKEYASGILRGQNGESGQGIKRIGSAEVAPVDESTLPGGWKELETYLDTAKDRVPNALGKSRSKITKQDLVNYLEEMGYDSEGSKDKLWQTAAEAIDDEAVDSLYSESGTAGQFLQGRLPGRGSRGLTDATNYYIGNKGRTGRLDAEYSDRLGIGRSNTPMSDRLVNPYGGAMGDYSEGAFGTDPDWATGESGVSTAAHERLHAMQDINPYDWDERVVDAIDELRKELGKHYHDREQIQKYWGGRKTDYYAKDIEQEARMLQSYLDNEGYTKRSVAQSEKGSEWGNEVKPAFDKFFDKLRELSKKGVALPAILAALGLGEYATENQEEDKDNGQQI